MVIMARNLKKYIALTSLGIIVGLTVKLVPSVMSQSTFSNAPVIICDAGHRGYALCFKIK